MVELKKISDDNESYKLLYSFIVAYNSNWKAIRALKSQMYGITIPKQGKLSDFEYFKLLEDEQKRKDFFPAQKYLLLVDDIPVTNIIVTMIKPGIADISFETLPNHRRKGYATLALRLTEEIVFRNPEILFTTITDISSTKYSSMLADKNGYMYIEELNVYIKPNSNLNLGETINTGGGRC